jgi:hypothetical protein
MRSLKFVLKVVCRDSETRDRQQEDCPLCSSTLKLDAVVSQQCRVGRLCIFVQL